MGYIETDEIERILFLKEALEADVYFHRGGKIENTSEIWQRYGEPGIILVRPDTYCMCAKPEDLITIDLHHQDDGWVYMIVKEPN